MTNLILIGGPMGVGKSTAARKLLNLLPSAVWLDGDWCWNASPFVVNEATKAVVLDNICHCLNNFLSCGQYGNIIFSWVMHEQSIINGILARLELTGVRVVNISLICPPEELLKRIDRDISRGERDEGVKSRALERLGHYGELDTIKIDTSLLDADGVAAAIEKLL